MSEGSSEPTVFVGTPIHTSLLHLEWVSGALSCHAQFPGRNRLEVQKGSFLPRQRDVLTKRFLQSECSHFLCVDSDIGWRASDVQRLIDTGKPIVSGIYCCKTESRKLPYAFNGRRDGELLGCDTVPAGFLLIQRNVVRALYDANRGMQYDSGEFGRVTALWSPMFDAATPYSSEDVSFCRRWTGIGGEIWAHPGVVLRHYGEAAFEPVTGWEREMQGCS
jgi:hypothetical protein